MIYCDAHCHLGSRQFDEDRDQMIERMLEADVSKAIIICCSRHDLDIGKKLKEKHPSFKLACSIHPQDLEDHDPKRLTEIRERIIDSGADMVGEIGLDYYSHPHTREDQKDFFKAQLEMAREFDLPIDVHCRKADGDMLEIFIMIGNFVLSSGYYDAYYNKALQVKNLIYQAFNEAFSKYDVVIGPVAPTPALKAGESLSDPLKMYLG
ncbi:MAG: TatD family hydrolase, partial [Erysipelotrichaceae bacterium]|nr:TatD family hydrolase [Erysipelotrichaceae bacterium]